MANPKDNGRVLAVCAHPDDIEFTCAGTLVLLKSKGYHVTLATVSDGDCGSMELSNEKIGGIRFKEAQAAARLMGAEYIHVGAHDLAFEFSDHWRRKMVDVLRRVDPFIVVTQPPSDYMFDHELTSALVRDATFSAAVPNYRTEHNCPTSGIPYLYYTDAMEGIDIFGDPAPVGFYVDVTASFETKQKMLACHDSQRSWLRAAHGMDEYLEMQRRWAESRGRQAGVKYAEAFRQHRGHPYPQENVLAKLIGVIERR